MREDNLFRKALAGSMSEGDGCLDAETVAAWADGALDSRASRAVEAHAARCARCQALVAAMARTAPEPPPPAWWRASPVRWLVPVAAGALAVTLWVMVPPALENNRRQGPSGPGDSKPVPSEPSAPVDALTAAPDAKADTRPADMARGRVVERDRQELKKESPPAPAREAESFRAAPMVAGAEGARQNAVAPAPQPRAELREDKDASARLKQRTLEPDGIVVSSPDPNGRWLVVPGGAVRRTTDGGATWIEQDIGSMQALAGAAPSPAVCWLVGRRGAVAVTVDGSAWRSVSSPAQADLVAVRASDDKTATVTAADGRMFTTSDAGRTWRSP